MCLLAFSRYINHVYFPCVCCMHRFILSSHAIQWSTHLFLDSKPLLKKYKKDMHRYMLIYVMELKIYTSQSVFQHYYIVKKRNTFCNHPLYMFKPKSEIKLGRQNVTASPYILLNFFICEKMYYNKETSLALGQIAAYVLLKVFINGNERCLTTDVSYHMLLRFWMC